MARQAGEFIENQFIRGLITEATGLNFPEKACIETWNTRFGKKGNVTRRLGIDIEEGEAEVTGVYREGVSKVYTWKTPGKTDRVFQVVQTGNFLNFFEGDAAGNFSDGRKPFTIDLADYKTEGTESSVAQLPASFATAEGRLYIVHQTCEALLVEYDPDADTISVEEIEIFIRDFEGVEDGLDIDEMPSTLSVEHQYNLYNQGWDTGEVEYGGGNTADNAIAVIVNFSEGLYPSNAMVWWQYKGVNGDGDETLRKPVYKSTRFGNSPAPKGHYIYSAFNIDRDTASGLSGLPSEQTTKRFSTIGFFAGRVWYGGIDDRIYYSQIVETKRNIGRCHQANDPTNEDLSDLLDTDGGVINILGVGRAVAFFALNNALVVFATNGIWSISGSGAQGTGFVATDFAVNKLSSIPMQSSISMVDVEGTPLWWNQEGIWTIKAGQGGNLEVASLSEDTIRTFLDEEVPISNRLYIQGVYNNSSRTVQWLYKSTEGVDVPDNFKYDRILELNVATGAFYPHKWNIANHFISAIFSAEGATIAESENILVTDSNLVVVTTSDPLDVFVTQTIATGFSASQIKYLSLDTGDPETELVFLEERDTDYEDFAYDVAVPFESYFISGVQVFDKGETGNTEYLTVFCEVEENASLYVQARWDWANSSASSKWSTTQQCYTANRAHRDVSRKRLLVRGSGPAVQFKWTSQVNKPFNLIGWSGVITVDAQP